MAKAKPTYKELVERQLECCVCLDTVRDPQTLQGCFHSVCSPCLEQLLGKEEDPEPGVTCPLSRTFSWNDNIRANFFIQGLVDIHISHTEKRMCEQCPASAEPTEASCKCLDCKMHMCTSCKDSHLKIRLLQGHRILPLTEATEFVVDHLVFCSHHLDEPIKLYCEQCQTPVCMMCTVTGHRGHECQTIQATLDKMVPQWESNIKYIEDKLQAVHRSSAEVDKKIEGIETEYKKCIVQIDKKAEERIAQIKTTQNQMKEDLKMKEREEIVKLEQVKRDLDEKRRDGENVRRVVRTTLDRARHASLLTELTQEGLVSNYDTVKMWEKKEEILVKLNMPYIADGDTTWAGVKECGLLGHIVYNIFSFLLTWHSVNDIQRVWDVDVAQYFLNIIFRPNKEIKLHNKCFRITPIKNHIWVPLKNSDLLVYDQAGMLVKTVNLRKAISVVEAPWGNIFIACGNGLGLYVTTGIDDTPERITTGSFTDVYLYRDELYVLDQGDNSIQKYMFSDTDSSKQKPVHVKSIPVGMVSEVKELDTFIACQSKHSDSVEFYVASRKKNVVYNYNEEGHCLNQYTHSLSNPYICGIDSGGNIIVGNKIFFSAIDTSNNKVIPLSLKGLQEDVNRYYDIRLDKKGALWVLYRQNLNTNVLVKLDMNN